MLCLGSLISQAWKNTAKWINFIWRKHQKSRQHTSRGKTWFCNDILTVTRTPMHSTHEWKAISCVRWQIAVTGYFDSDQMNPNIKELTKPQPQKGKLSWSQWSDATKVASPFRKGTYRETSSVKRSITSLSNQERKISISNLKKVGFGYCILDI